MTREEAIEILSRPKSMKGVPAEILTAHIMAIEALEQNPCDAVSREAAVNACLNGWNKDYKEIVADIKALPSVQPKQRTGRWIDRQKGTGILYPLWQRWECSECGACGLYGCFCQDCGAKMEEQS